MGKGEKDDWAVHIEAEVRIFGETSSAFNQNLPAYVISRTPKQILLVTLPAYRPRVARKHVFF